MLDLTVDEERALPLPAGWGPCIANDGSGLQYKNIKTGHVSSEHPFIAQALSVARKLPLPEGWSIKEAFLSDGSKDYFYTNERAALSLWDPPALRHCLADCLGANGHSAESLWILTGEGPPSTKASKASKGKGAHTNGAEEAAAVQASKEFNEKRMLSVQDAYEQFKKSGGASPWGKQSTQPKQATVPLQSAIAAGTVTSNEKRKSLAASTLTRDYVPFQDMKDDTAFATTEQPQPQPQKRPSMFAAETPLPTETAASNARRPSTLAVSPPPPPMPQDTQQSSPAYSTSDVQSQGEQSNLTLPSSIASITGIRSRSGKWEALRASLPKETVPPLQAATQTSTVAPPKTLSGLRILKQDIVEANERVHELMIRLRAELCFREGLTCNIIDQKTIPVRKQHYNYGIEDKSVDNSEYGAGGSKSTVVATYTSAEMVALAADIMAEIRHHPEHVICAMACCTPGSVGMPQIAFTALHRLLHPFSTDNSMTTAILLQGINFQVEECAHLEELFPEFDAKQLLSRAMFVADPEIAVGWNPLAQPMPVVPAVSSETVLTCLLRMYAIRRDVTSFFRTIWRPQLPSVIQVISSNEIDGNLTFGNLATVSYRLLEATLKEQSMVMFPPIATAMCRAIFEIGGSAAMHNYLFNLLILPNLLKIFGGSHDSLENETPMRFDKMHDFSVQFFDIDVWWPAEGFNSAPFSSFSTLVWLTWRFYSAASAIDGKTLSSLKTKDFFTGGPRLDMSSMPDTRLRSIIWHLQKRINEGCSKLLMMPLDAHGNEFLGVDTHSHLSSLPGNAANMRMLEQRLSALLLKPDDMLTLTVVSRHEIADLFSDIGIAMEAVGSAHDSHGFAPLHRAITEYLVINDEFGEETGEELMLIPFEFEGENIGGYNDRPNNGMRHVAGQKAEHPLSEEAIHYRHRQLRRGLALANRYEASLLRMINNLQRQDSTAASLYDLIEDEVMYSAPEFDVDCKVMKVPINEKHTKGWMSKFKNKHNFHGLEESQKILVHPSTLPFDALVAPALQVDWQRDKSEREIFEKAPLALRFNSTHASVSVGTSIARSSHKAPKLADQTTLIQTARGRSVKRTKRGHTRVTVNPDASFLEPTESFVYHQQQEKYQPPADLGKIYMESLRTDAVKDTESFQRNRRKNLSQSKGSNVVNRSSHGAPILIAKPFPEHLRHRVRKEATAPPNVGGRREADNYDDDEDSEGRENGEGGEEDEEEEGYEDYENEDYEGGGEEVEQSDEQSDNIQALLREYQELFGIAESAQGPIKTKRVLKAPGADPVPSRSRSPSPVDHSRSLNAAYLRRARLPYQAVHPNHTSFNSNQQSPARSRSPNRRAFRPPGSLDLDKLVHNSVRPLVERPNLPIAVENAYSTNRLRAPSNVPGTSRAAVPDINVDDDESDLADFINLPVPPPKVSAAKQQVAAKPLQSANLPLGERRVDHATRRHSTTGQASKPFHSQAPEISPFLRQPHSDPQARRHPSAHENVPPAAHTQMQDEEKEGDDDGVAEEKQTGNTSEVKSAHAGQAGHPEHKEPSTHTASEKLPSKAAAPARRMSTMQWLYHSTISPVVNLRNRAKSTESVPQPTAAAQTAPPAPTPATAPAPIPAPASASAPASAPAPAPASASAPAPTPAPTSAPASAPAPTPAPSPVFADAAQETSKSANPQAASEEEGQKEFGDSPPEDPADSSQPADNSVPHAPAATSGDTADSPPPSAPAPFVHRRSSLSPSPSPTPAPAPAPMHRPIRASLHERRASIEAERIRRTSISEPTETDSAGQSAHASPPPSVEPPTQPQPSRQQQSQAAASEAGRNDSLIALRRQPFTSPEASEGLSGSSPEAPSGAGSSRAAPEAASGGETPPASPSRGKPQVIKKSGFVVRDKDVLRKMLVDGVKVIKHGKAGKPKLKTLIYNPDKNELEWHDVGPKSRVAMLFGLTKTTTVSSVKVEDIIEVHRGVQTTVLTKAAGVDPLKTFSLVTADRSLDIVMATMQDRETMLRAIKVVLDDQGRTPLFT